MTAAEPAASRGRLRELARLFLRLGATAFGGPAAHVSMMHDEVVVRRSPNVCTFVRLRPASQFYTQLVDRLRRD